MNINTMNMTLQMNNNKHWVVNPTEDFMQVHDSV